MSSIRFTLKDLQERTRQFRLTPDKARDRLIAIRDMINELIDCKSDKRRIILYKKIVYRLCWGYSSMDVLPCWSKLANEPDNSKPWLKNV